MALLAATSCGLGGSPAVTAPDPVGFRKSDLVDILAPDDIRPITAPTFESIDKAAGWMTAFSPVIVVPSDAGTRAYPLAILLQHEVVNDQLGDTPIAVTYSPLTNAAVVLDRRIHARDLTFGTAGKLLQSDLVLFDHETKSLWWQERALSILGPLKGDELTIVPSQLASFQDFRSSFPDGRVLARPATGTSYEFTPYPSYDTRAEPYPGFFRGKVDPRMPAMQRVVGVLQVGGVRAYPYDSLARAGEPAVVQEGDRVVFWGGGARSVLNTPTLSVGARVGSGSVFRAVARGRSLHFKTEGHAIVDEETGSTWSLLGLATRGSLKGAQLEIIPHVDAFWFSWASWQPATTIWQP